jgi:hypothetical protein
VTAPHHGQAARLRNLIEAAEAATPMAERGTLFCSRKGYAVVHAAFKLFECDDLYDLRCDVEREIDSYGSIKAT